MKYWKYTDFLYDLWPFQHLPTNLKLTPFVNSSLIYICNKFCFGDSFPSWWGNVHQFTIEIGDPDQLSGFWLIWHGMTMFLIRADISAIHNIVKVSSKTNTGVVHIANVTIFTQCIIKSSRIWIVNMICNFIQWWSVKDYVKYGDVHNVLTLSSYANANGWIVLSVTFTHVVILGQSK